MWNLKLKIVNIDLIKKDDFYIIEAVKDSFYQAEIKRAYNENEIIEYLERAKKCNLACNSNIKDKNV